MNRCIQSHIVILIRKQLLTHVLQMLSFANHSYSCIFPFCSLLHDETVLSLEQANQLSQTVVNDQTHISIAMQVGFGELGGRTMLQPIINMLRFDGSLAHNVSSNPAERFDFFAN